MYDQFIYSQHCVLKKLSLFGPYSEKWVFMSNMKPFLLSWCTSLSQTSSKTTPWWCVAISYCVDDRTLWLLHPFHPTSFGYPRKIWWRLQILKLIRMLLFSNFMFLILFYVQIFSSASCSPATSIPEPTFLP
jgi:hypothetical protein